MTEYTNEEQLVLKAIDAEAASPYMITRDTKLNKDIVGEAIASLANRGIIKYDEFRGWIRR